MAIHAFVLGPDAHNWAHLSELTDDFADLKLHRLLTFEQLATGKTIHFAELLKEARSRLEQFAGSVDAIVDLWDFPSTLLAPFLCQDFGLPSADPLAAFRCEHKYWSRCLQREVVAEQVPEFSFLDPFADSARKEPILDFPFWIKPIKGHSSLLGFRIGNAAQLQSCLPQIRKGIARLGEPFNEAMQMLEVPPEIARIDGSHCVTEGLIQGRQCTLEGYVQNGRVTIYGMVDSRRYSNRSTFQRYQYPSRLPRAVQGRMRESARRVVQKMGLDNTTFNIEYYHHQPSDRLWLLEINPRCSQSHADLFVKVDGTTHQRIKLDLQLGRPVVWNRGGGEFATAAKFFYRRFQDGLVEEVPSEATLNRLQNRFPGCAIELQVEPGEQLAHKLCQDSYSFELARVYLGAANTRELLSRYQECRELLEPEFKFGAAKEG